MTREDLLKDEWVKENFADACYPNYLEPNFEAGVEYGERKAIEKACEWIQMNAMKYINTIGGCMYFDVINSTKDFKKAMEDEI